MPGEQGFGSLVPCPDCNSPARRLQWFQQRSGLSGSLLACRIEDWYDHPERTDAVNAALAFLAQPCGWLTLWGGFGVGKTYLLASICNALIERQVAVYYQTGPGLLNALKSAFDEKGEDSYHNRFYQLCRLPLLAIDELDKVRLTEWARETLFELLEYRYRNLDTTGTLLAMNTEPRCMTDDWGYLRSRIYDKRSRVLTLPGVDFRGMER